MPDGSAGPVLPVADACRWLVLAVVVAAQFMFVVDAFIVNVALPSVAADLKAGPGEMEAVIAVYQASYAALVIIGGRLGDIHSRRPTFIAGVLGFTAASAWCGLAGSATGLILARLAQGATAAMMVPQVLATLHVLFPGPERSRAFAIFGIALGTGGATGFLLGGWLVTLDPVGLGWRAIFLVNLPVGVLIALAACRLMPQLPTRRGTKLDLGGAALLFIGLLGLLGPVLAGRRLGWPAWVWAVAGGAGVALLGFVALERRVQRRGGQPLLDLELLREEQFRHGLAIAACFQFGNVAFYLVANLVMQGRLALTPLQSGASILPLAIAFTIASQLAARWTARHGTRVLLWGCAGQLAGLVAFGELAQNPAGTILVVTLAVFGFGQGLVMAPLAGLVLARATPTQAGAASGLLNTVQQASGAVGVTAVGLAYATGGLEGGLWLLGSSIVGTAVLLVGWRDVER